MNKLILSITAAIAILGTASNASAQACDVDSYSQDPADFADLAVDDLNDEARGYYSDATLVRGDIAYTGTILVGSGCNFFGMENDPDAFWNCTDSGGNVFEQQGDLALTPLVAANRIAFQHSKHFGPFTVDITLSDGSQRTFVVEEPHASVWGWDVNYGFFGYCTGDPSLTITKVFVGNEDAAIDNVRLGVVAAPECNDNDGDGVTDCDGDCNDADAAVYPGATEVCDGKDNTCDGLVDGDTEGDLCAATCDIDSLAESVIALNAPEGLTTAMLKSVENAETKIAEGRPETAANMLDALINKLEAQAGKKVDADEAYDVIACIGAIVVSLREG